MDPLLTAPALVNALILLVVYNLVCFLYGKLRPSKSWAYAPSSDRLKLLSYLRTYLSLGAPFKLTPKNIQEASTHSGISTREFHVLVNILEEQNKLKRSFEDGVPVLLNQDRVPGLGLEVECSALNDLIQEDKATSYRLVHTSISKSKGKVRYLETYYCSAKSLAKLVTYEYNGKELTKFERISRR